LKSVGIGEFTLKENGATVFNGGGLVGAQEFIHGRPFGAVPTKVCFEGLTFEHLVGGFCLEPSERNQFTLREQERMLGKRER
jgi:hypothetical protein